MSQREALADYPRAIDLDPKNPSHYFARSLVYRDLNRTPDAAADEARANALYLQRS